MLFQGGKTETLLHCQQQKGSWSHSAAQAHCPSLNDLDYLPRPIFKIIQTKLLQRNLKLQFISINLIPDHHQHHQETTQKKKTALSAGLWDPDNFIWATGSRAALQNCSEKGCRRGWSPKPRLPSPWNNHLSCCSSIYTNRNNNVNDESMHTAHPSLPHLPGAPLLIPCLLPGFSFILLLSNPSVTLSCHLSNISSLWVLMSLNSCGTSCPFSLCQNFISVL